MVVHSRLAPIRNRRDGGTQHLNLTGNEDDIDDDVLHLLLLLLLQDDDGCSRLFWFAEDSGLFWKGSTCHSTGLFQTILE